MARADHLQLRLLERVEQAVDLRAGQAEHGVDAVRDQARDDGFAAGTHCHGFFPSLASRFMMASSTTPLRSTPIFSASTSTTSPGFR